MKWFWITNFVLFQLSWFCAAFYTANATLLILALLAIHFVISPSRLSDAKLLVLMLVGVAVDSVHFELGTFSSGEHPFPVWLALLWCMFLVSLNHSLNWLVDKSLWLLAGFGAIGGTSSYIAGIKAGALQTDWPFEWVIITLLFSWGLLFPLLVLGYRYINPKQIEG
jgi:hypothetical protein